MASERSATDSVKDAASGIRDSIGAFAEEQAQRATSGVKSLIADRKDAAADRLEQVAAALRDSAESMAENGERDVLGTVIGGAAERIDRLSRSVRDGEVDEWGGEMRAFAREQPGMVFLGALAAGFLAVRFFRASGEDGGRQRFDRDDRLDRSRTYAADTGYGASPTAGSGVI